MGKINYLRRFISNLAGRIEVFTPLLRLKDKEEFIWTERQQEAFENIKRYLSNPPVLVPPKSNQPMKLYISAAVENLGCLLAQENEEKEEQAIYYLSKRLLDTEKRAIKGQAIADFLADHPCVEIEEPKQSLIGCQRWVLYFDGSRTTESAGAGIVIQSPEGYRVPASEMYAIIKPWPFRGWAMDLIGKIQPNSSAGHKFLIVAIDYFTKWVEARPTRLVTQKEIIDFVEDHIIHRFGISETVTTDQGTMFMGGQFVRFIESRKIKLLHSSPYYAQANGQVEATNKIIINLMKRHIGKYPRKCNEKLSEVLWACRTSIKTTTRMTPFQLVYGHEAVIPAEITVPSLRLEKQKDLSADEYY
ncbi:uncharacterized protein LOC109705035 [Ananas comosus]|uniref:Uncharacterized protein LOC109705035 n=1 Tax=Ananas comosus TaxID=4615 RepID=A0A6P5EDR0_ANACO|nr:uncharacterized protein LOC109705035 [Ananas comosus]